MPYFCAMPVMLHETMEKQIAKAVEDVLSILNLVAQDNIYNVILILKSELPNVLSEEIEKQLSCLPKA